MTGRVALAAVAMAAVLAAVPAQAKDARCFTSDDGEYACKFEALDKAGSFRISGKGKPTFEVWIDAPGQATVGATFEAGGRSVALPGIYERSQTDGACWISVETGTQICAW